MAINSIICPGLFSFFSRWSSHSRRHVYLRSSLSCSVSIVSNLGHCTSSSKCVPRSKTSSIHRLKLSKHMLAMFLRLPQLSVRFLRAMFLLQLVASWFRIRSMSGIGLVRTIFNPADCISIDDETKFLPLSRSPNMPNPSIPPT